MSYFYLIMAVVAGLIAAGSQYNPQPPVEVEHSGTSIRIPAGIALMLFSAFLLYLWATGFPSPF